MQGAGCSKRGFEKVGKLVKQLGTTKPILHKAESSINGLWNKNKLQRSTEYKNLNFPI